MLDRLAERNLQTKFGTFREILYSDGRQESIALVMGQVESGENVLCRIHSACISAHIFNSIECDCREQMEISQRLIEQARKGIIIWLDQEGRGHGHLALMNAAKLARAEDITQTEAYTKLGFSEDARSYRKAAEILNDLKISSVVVLTNNPKKIKDLIRDGIVVNSTKQVVVNVDENTNLKSYYADKIKRGHNIEFDDL